MGNHSAFEDIRRLQLLQYKHDLLAHQDILCLPVPRRLIHFTLHFSKYIGALLRAHREGDSQAKTRVLSDAFIIALASANALNVDLEKVLPRNGGKGTSLGPTDFQGSTWKLCEIVGEMAKACESTDHLENFPSRQTLDRCIVDLVSLLGALAAENSISLDRTIAKRWELSEKRSFLFERNVVQSPDFLSVA
jgi:hypothetical protein